MMGPLDVRIVGPLVPYVVGFYVELISLGYRPWPAIFQVRFMAHVSRWLESHGLSPGEFTPERATQFLAARRRAGYVHRLSSHALTRLVAYLRRLQVVPEPPPVVRSAIDRLVDLYCEYLLRERGLAPRSLLLYRPMAHRFLSAQFPAGGLRLRRLTAEHVTGFVVRSCRTRPISYAKLVVATLRSLLRFLFLRGYTSAALTVAVPAIASWRLASLPRPVASEWVPRLLQTCDKSTSAGRRAYAVLLVVTRLGLRASEVAGLQLDDVDWRAGEITVRGKGQRQEKLPLPPDVGRAMAEYVRRDRPRVPARALFLRRFAPLTGFGRGLVSALVRQACVRAGIPQFGAHRLRHTLATEMLRRGASLSSIAQVLRHRSVQSTAIYAKVDRSALRALAQPWPGGEP